MAYSCLATRREGPVEHLTLNRPEVRNALNETLIAELTHWASTVPDAQGPRLVVLSGAGQAFCAGADLEWMSRAVTFTRDENRRDASALAAMYAALDRVPVPLLARVHGAALGGGAGLLAVCDIVVADEAAVFGFTEVRLGILPAVISPYVLAKIGASAARELFLTGMRFGAGRARDIGLVHCVADAAEIDAQTAGYTREILGAAPGAVTAAKTLIHDLARASAVPALDLANLTAERRVSPEGQEGMRAFLEKRRASWHVSPNSDR